MNEGIVCHHHNLGQMLGPFRFSARDYATCPACGLPRVANPWPPRPLPSGPFGCLIGCSSTAGVDRPESGLFWPGPTSSLAWPLGSYSWRCFAPVEEPGRLSSLRASPPPRPRPRPRSPLGVPGAGDGGPEPRPPRCADEPKSRSRASSYLRCFSSRSRCAFC